MSRVDPRCTNQTYAGHCINWEHALVTAGLGIAAGTQGMGGSALGGRLFGSGLDSLGQQLPLGGNYPTLAKAGGIMANSLGTILGSWLYP